MATITTPAGTVYHVFSLECSTRDSTESIHFTELENDLSDGYFSQLLFGSNTGLRNWKLAFPTLPGSQLSGQTVDGINGELLSKEAYLWDLFVETKVTGEPFVVQSKRNDQYYLVRFADKELSYTRMLTKLYTTGIELKQVRVLNETVWSPANVDATGAAFDPVNYNAAHPSIVWPASGFNNSPISFEFRTGDVVAATSGTQPIVRFNNTTNDGFLFSGTTITAKDIIILMKMREATFSNNAGIVTADVTAAALIGAVGTTKFFDLGMGAPFSYRKDGVSYLENNQQAPMNAWGAVHVRHTGGMAMANPQIGKDRDFAGRFAEMDVAYLIVSEDLLPNSTLREIDEFLAILKGQLA